VLHGRLSSLKQPLLLTQSALTFTGSTTYAYPPANTLPLWYSSLNGAANFDDFVPFGGFTAPHAKQYLKVWDVCGLESIFEDWAPEW
jgi:hypothetical protein